MLSPIRDLLAFCMIPAPDKLPVHQSSVVVASLMALCALNDPALVGLLRAQDSIQSAGLEGPHRWGLMLPTSARVALPTYVPLLAVRYVELVRWAEDLKRYVIGSRATGGLRDMPHGLLTVAWDRRGPTLADRTKQWRLRLLQCSEA